MVAAILATLMLLAPVALAADAEYDYAENGEDPVATFSATDPDADAGDIEWDVSGVDAEFFEISDGGVLSFVDPPDFEDKKDKDEDTVAAGPQGEGDNVYQVTVVANEGELEVAVTVTDVDEPGEVTFDQPQPQATRSLEADGPDDEDGGVDEISWQWSRSENADGPWTDITGATAKKRTPDTDDIGHYLRATVTYVDVHGDQSVSGVTDNPVEARTLANAAPEFDEDDIKPIEVPENTKGKIGEPIVASDDDNDELLYDVDTASTTGAENDNALFTVDDNGQLSLTDPLDFEASAKTANDDGLKPYTVVLRATDPSRASGSVTVMVLLEDANESPEFAKDAEDNFEQTTLYIAEDGATAVEGPGLSTTADGAAAAADQGTTAITYAATDDDNTVTDNTDTVTYKLEGADKDSFSLTETGGLTTLQADTATDPETPGLKANFEDKSEYSITIVAVSADGDTNDDDARGTKYTRLDVTVKVVDREDTGTIKLSALQSQVNIPVVATHSDEDGGVTDRRWQWYRGGELPDNLADLSTDSDGILLAASVIACVDGDDPDTTDVEERTAAGDLCRIAGETSALYTTGDADVARNIHVVANYKDDFASGEREDAGVSSEAEVQASFSANTAPKFPDQDLSTPGDQSDVAMRSVAENEDKGTMVGEPIPAGDTDSQRAEAYGEVLTYTIDDTDNFSVNQKDGQISTAVELDFETQSMYTVMLTATDPSGATATITVMISVTDADDPATITADAEYDYAENGEDPVATFSATDPDADAGDIEWDVSGVDAEFFEISDEGVLSFVDPPDFEDKKDKDEDTTAAGPQGEGDNVYQVTVVASDGELEVAVTVTDVDEPGEVTFDQPQPQATRSLEADGPDDEDGGVDEISWQWSRSESADGPWTDITGATAKKRTPDTDDIGHYLRATVTYVDVHGDQSVSGVTDNPVEARTLANAAPEFDKDDIKPIKVPENTKGKIGEPIVASDDDNDELLYDVDTASTTGAENDNALFTVDDNGQLSLTDPLDFEASAKTANDDGLKPYTVVLRATDPSRASGSVTVMVLLEDANESPEFAKDAEDNFEQTTLYIAEDGATAVEGPGLSTTADGAAAAADQGTTAITYAATDDDNTVTDNTDAVTYRLEGADKDSFSLTPAGGLTTLQAADSDDGLKANFEDKSEYSITIVAVSADGDTNDDDARGTTYSRLDVTVKVVDREDTGTIKLSALQSQVNIPVVATHSDEDGGVTDRRWQWYRGGTTTPDAATIAALFDASGDLITTATGNDACEVDDPDTDTDEQTQATTLCRIDGETAALYTPGDADVARNIHVVANYKDDFASGTRENASASSEAIVQASYSANTAPKFPDQDFGTPGDQSDTAMRSVAENEDKGTMVGEPIPAGDTDSQRNEAYGEVLTYTIDDTDNFSVNQKDGQISTAVELDYETQSMYTVMLTATDPSGATDTINGDDQVTDEADDAVITLGRASTPRRHSTRTRHPQRGREHVCRRGVGDPVEATDDDAGDTVTYELSGSMYFAIDGSSGQISTTMMLDYEAMSTTHTVTVTASDEEGATDTVNVTINVNDAHPGCTYVVPDTRELILGLTNDCEALLDAKEDLGGDLNWSGDTHMVEWDGVTVS